MVKGLVRLLAVPDEGEIFNNERDARSRRTWIRILIGLFVVCLDIVVVGRTVGHRDLYCMAPGRSTLERATSIVL